MKKKQFVGLLVLLVAVFASVGSFAGDREKYGFYVPSPFEEWCGTWVNTDPAGPPEVKKIINYEWGYYEGFWRPDDASPVSKGCSTLVEKWTDSEGNIWYKEFDREPYHSRIFCLNRLSKDASVLEYVWTATDFPSAKDLLSKNAAMHYNILYRK